MDEDFDQNRNRDQRDYDREHWRNQRRMSNREPRRQGWGMEEEPSDRGYYGRGYGYGESPYTSYPPNYENRISSGESPYTDYGPATGRGRGGYGESPYTSHPPASYTGRYSSGESPYTDYGPSYTRQQGMQRFMPRNMRGRSMDRDYEEEWDYYEPTTYSYTEIWMIPGPDTGKGPQGYNRSDERIEDDICDRLMLHGRVDASDISVNVDHGEVTLAGTVHSRQEKRMVEDTAESVMGVKDVHNQLKVKHEGQTGNEESQV